MPRFLHSADWQLGMTRHFLSEEAQARFSQDRLDAVRALGRLARDEACEFVVVAGDVFESNQVDRRTIARAIEALRAIDVPVYLLPGNHDPLDAASVFRSPAFAQARPDHVHVLDDEEPRTVREGLEVVGAPWRTKRPLRDLAADVAGRLEPGSGVTRVLVAHGAVDVLSPDPDDPALIGLTAAEHALAEGRIQFLALGDRHSVTDVGSSGRIWYAGAPEATDYGEERPGHALVVDVDAERVDVTAHAVGHWHFVAERVELETDDDLDALETLLDGLPDKERTALKLSLVGTLSLRRKAALDALLERSRDVFGALEIWERHTELVVRPDDDDFSDLDLAGFARDALDELRAAADGDDAPARTARDALGLLVRFAGRSA